MPEDQSSMSFSDALKEVIKNLKGQPLFLFILGTGLLFLLAGSMVNVLLPLGFIVILGVVIWGFLETQKLRQGKIESGGINVDRRAKAEKVEAETGRVSGVAGKSAEVSSGDIKIGSFADLKDSKFKTGEVKVNAGDSCAEKKPEDK